MLCAVCTCVGSSTQKHAPGVNDVSGSSCVTTVSTPHPVAFTLASSYEAKAHAEGTRGPRAAVQPEGKMPKMPCAGDITRDCLKHLHCLGAVHTSVRGSAHDIDVCAPDSPNGDTQEDKTEFRHVRPSRSRRPVSSIFERVESGDPCGCVVGQLQCVSAIGVRSLGSSCSTSLTRAPSAAAPSSRRESINCAHRDSTHFLH
jgi:hypothetical protein